MRASVCSEFLHHLDGDARLAVGHSPKVVIAWLDRANLPWDLDHLIRFNWPQKSGYLAHLHVSSAKQILDADSLADFLPHRFLPIGSAPYGDSVVVRFDPDQCEVGFISHEEYSEHKDDPGNVYQPIARTLESLLFKVVEGRYIPTDYYAAKEFNAFLKEERGTA
jgi:hypothetical protein